MYFLSTYIFIDLYFLFDGLIYNILYLYGEIMENKILIGIIAFILGIIVIAFPLLSVGFLVVASGLSVCILAIYWIIRGIQHWNENKATCVLYVLVGLFAFFFGLVLTGNFPLFLFTSSFLLYIIGFLMIIFGIAGIINNEKNMSKISSLLFFIFGIVLLIFANLIFENPLYLALIIGIALMIEGISLILESKDKKIGSEEK